MAPGGDAHTGLYVWSPRNRAVHSLPLRWWSFSDGLAIESVLDVDASLVGARVVAIAGRPVGEVERLVDPLVPHETPSSPLLLRPR